MTRIVGAVADRLLSFVAPKATAAALCPGCSLSCTTRCCQVGFALRYVTSCPINGAPPCQYTVGGYC
ncbi:hypothetical protein Vau01_111700 [Virgisporangium aurantiacum]|uniref:Uncharacterized protein n=1 Tax=Virgisporangium aurantiacum TaxID=175570 RepID=A0A8J4E6X0_9ACTN|nr:hypothetical protein Vau01_111700 [Virgisporangium aurantiacum]